ncbi:MAG: DUF1080 domain-containing protein [Planctomycetota bacterium]
MRPAVPLSLLLPSLLTFGACAAGRGGFEPAFRSGSFAGWHTAPGGEWAWRGDVLVGTSSQSEKRHGLLISDATYGDFEARLSFRVLAGDSGFYFRLEEVGGAAAVAGLQAEVDQTLDTGGLYETGGRGWIIKPDHARMADVYRPGEWTRLRVSAVAGDVDVFVNDVHTASLRDDPGRREGHFGLQLHGGQDMHVEFRDLEFSLSRSRLRAPSAREVHLVAATNACSLLPAEQQQRRDGRLRARRMRPIADARH